MFKVSKVKLSRLFRDLDGTIARVTFIKQDGSLRDMNFRLGVSKGIKSAASNRVPVDRYDTPYIVAYDLQAKGYRTINLNTVLNIKARGVNYTVV